MRDCLHCNNKVDEGRVLSICNGCLALHYYGDALDVVMDLAEEGIAEGRVTEARLYRIRAVARNAIKAVPVRTPGGSNETESS